MGLSSSDLDRIIASALADALSDDEVAGLAVALAASGEVLQPAEDHADVASTGGPSSLSTLLCPLYIHALGARAAALGVPGRPAGGVDVLATIPGFQTTLDRAGAEKALRSGRHVHLVAGGAWAPMDATLFSRRQRIGAQQASSLVIASLLSKKLALGVTSAGLDVRVAAHGNFGADIATARDNAARFVAVADLLGIRAVCFLTDGTRPYQPYIGRGEALQAIASALEDRASGALSAHIEDCRLMAAHAVGGVANPVESQQLVAGLEACLLAQGSSLDAFRERVRSIAEEPRVQHRAPCEGRLSYDLQRLRDLLVDRQRREATIPFADPAGVVLERPEGSLVDPGELLMTSRVRDGDQDLARQLASCARVVEGADGELRGPASSLLEVVT